MTTKYQSKWEALLLLLPSILATVVILYYPAFNTFRLSLFQTRRGFRDDVYVGLENFRTLLSSSGYHSSLFWSFAFVTVVVIGSVGLSILIGFLIHRASVGSSYYLVAGMVAYGFSFAVAAVVIQFIFLPQHGLLHELSGWSFDWLTNGYPAFLIICLATIWKMIGFNLIFIVGALSGIPDTLDDAAKLDGVSGSTMLARVYLPLIAPTLAFLVVMNTVYAFFLPYPVVDILTNGSPETTNLLIYELYQTGIAQGATGEAAAQSIVLFVIVGALMLLQLVLSERSAYVGGA